MNTPMTVAGEQALRDELARLQAQRVELAKAIGAAIKLGDLSENADYHANKDKQGLVEVRIRTIQSRLASAQVIDVTKIQAKGRVVFGATVTLRDLDTEKQFVYQIVGEDEANVSAGKISIISPVARALIGQSTGEEIEVETATGLKFYTIENIAFV